jgi:membrane fusion protein (multidrug efflux system)
MKRAIIVIVALVIGAVAVVLVRLHQINQANQEHERMVSQVNSEQVTPVIVAPVTTGEIERTLKYTGTVESEDEVNVYSKISGRLVSVKVEEGDQVAKNEVVAVIDPEVTGQRFEPYEVTSPIEGNISAVYLDAGTYLTQMQPIVKVINDRNVRVGIEILEKDYNLVKEGTPVRLRFDALPGKMWTAKVTNLVPVVDPMTGTAKADIQMANRDGSLKAGMFARVEIVLEVHKDAVLMPLAATLTEILPGRGTRVKTQVFVAEGDIARQRDVTLGLVGPAHYEVLEGLKAGEMVITVGQSLVHDGSKLRITRAEGEEAG